jgi:hypothetical protein
MIGRQEVMPLLLDACPSFHQPWNEYLSEATYEEGLLYLDLGALAHHLVRLMQKGQLAELPGVFAVIERLHVEGDPFVQEAVTIGLLEGIQNVASDSDIDPELFRKYLQPESAKWWNELDRFWKGDAPYVGAGLKKSEAD